MVSEFDLIKRFFTHPTRHTTLGVGDDAALVRVAPGHELAVSTDMLVSGRHFLVDAEPYSLGRKSLAVNLSDMAAMGATPRWATLGIALPEANEKWIESFAGGLLAEADAYSVDLIGGDTTRGPLNICVTILGEMPEGQALRRDGARVGDEIWVSGALGDAALGLAYLQKKVKLEATEAEACLRRLHTPSPRVALGQCLRGIAHSAIDISDGLLADLGHILERSRVGARVELASIPTSSAVRVRITQPSLFAVMLAGGDDYELCFTAPAQARGEIEQLSRDLAVRLTRIGITVSERGLLLLEANGRPVETKVTGYDHFG